MSNVVICTVLKTSDEYKVEHAIAMQKNLEKFGMGDLHYCITNVDKIDGVRTIKMKEDWPSWWCKINMFDMDSEIGSRDLLFVDLDSVFVKSPEIFLNRQDEFVMLSDFYHLNDSLRPASSGFMYVPARYKSEIYNAFKSDAEAIMRRYVNPPAHGDQGFIHAHLRATGIEPKHWQDILSGSVVSYKKDVARKGAYSRSEGNGYVPNDAHLVCFHGNPRPWHSGVELKFKE